MRRAAAPYGCAISATGHFPRPGNQTGAGHLSGHLGVRNLGYDRQTTLIHEQMMFAAELATIGRVSTRMLAACRGRYAGSINASSIPRDLVVLSQSSQNSLVDALPNAGLHPFVQPTSTSHAAATAEFARQVFPRYTRPSAFRRSAMDWEMSCYKRPKVFGEKCLGHGISPSWNMAAISPVSFSG